MKQSLKLSSYIGALDPGLERAILRVMEKRVGRAMAIGRYELVDLVRQLGVATNERRVRAMVNQLRKDGHLICSAGGADGGYWLAENWAEVSEFLGREIHPRAMDLLETEKHMKMAAAKRWGPEQARLF